MGYFVVGKDKKLAPAVVPLPWNLIPIGDPAFEFRGEDDDPAARFVDVDKGLSILMRSAQGVLCGEG